MAPAYERILEALTREVEHCQTRIRKKESAAVRAGNIALDPGQDRWRKPFAQPLDRHVMFTLDGVVPPDLQPLDMRAADGGA